MASKKQKDPDAYRTISEISEELNVPQHVLRFWETKFEQVQPMKRNGRRRYYRPEDRELLTGIRDLLYGEGYTIRGVQKLLAEGIACPADLKGRAEAEPVAPQAPMPLLPPLAQPPANATADQATAFRIQTARERLAALAAALG